MLLEKIPIVSEPDVKMPREVFPLPVRAASGVEAFAPAWAPGPRSV